MLLDAFRWFEVNLPGSLYLRESTYGFSVLLTVHVVAMCIFLGLVVMMDLRLVGVAHLRSRAAEVQARLFPWEMVGFAIIVTSGVMMLWAQPLRYYGKTFFWWKMGLMLLAGLNAGVIHAITHRSEAAWDTAPARIAGTASLVLWTGVMTCGRLVSYEWMTTEYQVD
jgi:hypothetical protein